MLGVSAEYRQMVHYGDEVFVLPTVVQFNGLKLGLRYEIRNVQSGELTTTGTSSHCFLDADYRPLRLKKEFPEVYRMFADCCQASGM